MIRKIVEKNKAITLRKKGKSYNEIMEIVSVSKSTLSLWLRDVGLSKKQTQRFSLKKHQAQLRGGAARKADRIERTAVIANETRNLIGTLSDRERLLVGSALYWAEGSKEKSYRPSARLDFANSDPAMVRFYVNWLRNTLNVPDADIQVMLHIHENRIAELDKFHKFWLKTTGLKSVNLVKPVIKKHIPKTKRYNVADTYHGLVAIRVRRSTILNRRVQGCINAIANS